MTKSPKKGQKLKASTKDLFDQWRDATTLRSGDSSSTRWYKITMRILGIVLIIIFSPLILLILLFALLAAL